MAFWNKKTPTTMLDRTEGLAALYQNNEVNEEGRNKKQQIHDLAIVLLMSFLKRIFYSDEIQQYIKEEYKFLNTANGTLNHLFVNYSSYAPEFFYEQAIDNVKKREVCLEKLFYAFLDYPLHNEFYDKSIKSSFNFIEQDVYLMLDHNYSPVCFVYPEKDLLDLYPLGYLKIIPIYLDKQRKEVSKQLYNLYVQIAESIFSLEVNALLNSSVFIKSEIPAIEELNEINITRYQGHNTELEKKVKGALNSNVRSRGLSNVIQGKYGDVAQLSVDNTVELEFKLEVIKTISAITGFSQVYITGEQLQGFGSTGVNELQRDVLQLKNISQTFIPFLKMLDLYKEKDNNNVIITNNKKVNDDNK